MALLALTAFPGCRPAGVTGEPAAPAELAPGAPRLVLLVVIDQGGAGAVDRLRPLLGGGLGRLLDESARFTDAHHDHALTETAPGHATLATGRHPSRHGIVSNYWFDPETGEEVYAVDDPAHDTSPHHLRVDALGDWLRAASPGSKVFALGGKNRTAVLLGGRKPDGAFWYDDEIGRFVTSDYYPEPPPWLAAFHREHPLDADYGLVWEPLPEVAAAAGRFDFARPFLGELDRFAGFPHTLGGAHPAPTPGYYEDIYDSPFADAYLARLAAALLAAEELGRDGAPDLLALGFSALDAVGHRYGPDSLEYADTLARLDRTLDDLLALVDRRVGLDRTLVVVSADHGVVTNPEVAARRGEAGRRLGAADIRCLQGLEAELDRRLGRPEKGDWLRPGPFVDPDTLRALGMERRVVEETAREVLEACPGVARVWTRTGIEALAESGRDDPAPASVDPLARLYRHAYHRGRSPDLLVQLEPGALDAGIATAAGHGTPYPYDTHVPWLIRGPGIEAREIPGRVVTADVAPTIAALLGIPVPEDLDGIDRSPILRHAPAPPAGPAERAAPPPPR